MPLSSMLSFCLLASLCLSLAHGGLAPASITSPPVTIPSLVIRDGFQIFIGYTQLSGSFMHYAFAQSVTWAQADIIFVNRETCHLPEYMDPENVIFLYMVWSNNRIRGSRYHLLRFYCWTGTMGSLECFSKIVYTIKHSKYEPYLIDC